jgi:apolipoprotein N-acyltransferase
MTRSLVRIGDAVRGLAPWRARLLAMLAGALSALAFAPFGVFPLLLLGFAALVVLLDAAQARPRPIRAAAWLGWAFGFGQFAVGLHWIAFAFLVDPTQHAWQIPFVAVLFPGGLALFTALAAAVAMRLWRKGAARIFVFAACYGLSEWLRGHVLTGFPWNLAAYGWGAVSGVLQSLALFGVYGLSLLTALFGASLAELFAEDGEREFPMIMTVVFALVFLGGALRLATVRIDEVPGVRLRIVQPNIAQADKYRPELIDRNWNRLLELSNAPAKEPVTHILWPEAAPPFVLTRSPEALDAIALLTGRDKVLMTGAVRVLRGEPRNRYYNSFYLFGHGGRLLDIYDKAHLVPFGEYLPYEDVLGRLGLTKIVGLAGSFAVGSGPRTLDVPGLPQSEPMICYEILFPDEIAAHRPRTILNVSDDSWFGPWAGPLQHLLVARTRAIEQGVPVIRATNTGISAVIDPLGRVRAELALNRAGVLDSNLPAPIEPTPYARSGAFVFWLLLAACLLGAYVSVQNLRFRAFRNRHPTVNVL